MPISLEHFIKHKHLISEEYKQDENYLSHIYWIPILYVFLLWLISGKGRYLTIVDTPGFDDSEGPESQNELVDEMMNVLKYEVKEANALIILIKGTETRFDSAFQQTIRDMISLFGNAFWNNVVIGVSFWRYDPYHINDRQRNQKEAQTN